jgi:hypothetical protein
MKFNRPSIYMVISAVLAILSLVINMATGNISVSSICLIIGTLFYLLAIMEVKAK